MITIALDAMGGDHAPDENILGAYRAIDDLSINVILVGQEDVIKKCIKKHNLSDVSSITICNAEEIVGNFYSKEFIRKRILKQTDEEVQQIDKQIEAEKAAAPPEEEEESFVPKQDKFMKEDIKLKKEMNDIMKSVLSES